MKELEERVVELEEESESLEDTVTALSQQVERLEDQKGDLEDRIDTLEGEKKALAKSLQPYEDLASALTMFLSWLDHPPTGMSPVALAQHLADCRRDLDYALREVTR